MITNADAIARDSVLDADVCIVGAGAAGIALALSLSGRGLSILLMESGFSAEDARTQALYEGEVRDDNLHSPPDKYRLRRFGGSTAIWGGRCMPFDPIDFEARDYLPGSAWPISYADVAPYFKAANDISEAGDCIYDADRVFDPVRRPMIKGFVSDKVLTNSLERFACPTNFGARYEKRLRLAPDIRVILGANCTRIEPAAGGTSVERLAFASLEGNRFGVRARAHVLATGGIEVARLLLASKGATERGLGNEHDLVGRHYMCHIAGNVGTLEIAGPVSNVRHGYEISPEGIYCRRRLSLSPGEQRRIGAGNMVARLHFPRIVDPAHRNGVLSGLFLAKNFISYEYGKRLNDGAAPTFSTYVRHVGNILTDPFDTIAFAGHWLTKRTLAARKFPSVILRNKTNRFSLEVHSEQFPNAQSRITLAETRDELGMPKVRIDWRYQTQDISSVAKTLDIFAEEFSRTGVGRFTYEKDTLEEDLVRFGAYGGHHIGTTRMGVDPRTSVVDGNCRLHTVDNLYVASSAVFPTSSQANPTLMIIAMALRLGAHLDGRLRQPAPVTVGEALA